MKEILKEIICEVANDKFVAWWLGGTVGAIIFIVVLGQVF
jgi:hypothetical protein